MHQTDLHAWLNSMLIKQFFVLFLLIFWQVRSSASLLRLPCCIAVVTHRKQAATCQAFCVVCCAVLCGAVRCCAVRCGAVLCCAVRYASDDSTEWVQG